MNGRRFAGILAGALVFAAAAAGALALHRAAADRRHGATGPARWIWLTREIPREEPLRFAAWKDFRLERAPETAARALLFADREGTLDVNGTVVGRVSQKPGDALASFDLAPFLHAGENRVRVEAGSPSGAGGVLFFLRLPGGLEIATDASWTVERLPAGGEPPRAASVWGKPPMHPWGYPAAPEP